MAPFQQVFQSKFCIYFCFHIRATFSAHHNLPDRIIRRTSGEKNATRKQKEQLASEEKNTYPQDIKHIENPAKPRINSKFQILPCHSYILSCHTLHWFHTRLKQSVFTSYSILGSSLTDSILLERGMAVFSSLPVHISTINSYNYLVI